MGFNNLKLKGTKDEPKKATKTNTMIDCNKIELKLLASKFAQALYDEKSQFGAATDKNKYAEGIEVDLGSPCAHSQGGITGTYSKIEIGATKVSESIKSGKNFISFELSHCGGGTV